MDAPAIDSRIRAWLVVGMECLWSQLPRSEEASGLAAVAVDVARFDAC